MSIGTFRDDILFWKKPYHFRAFMKNCSVFVGLIQQGCQNCVLRVNGNILRRVICYWKKFFYYHFRTLNEIFSAFVNFSLTGFFQTAFYLSRGTFWGPFSTEKPRFFLPFLESERKSFDFFCEKHHLSELHSKWPYVYFGKKISFVENKFFISFGT